MTPNSPLVDAVMPSPNFGDRRGRAIDAIVLHYTGMATGALALDRLRDPAAEVSCHYLVWEDGRIAQLVAEADRAWHAGRGTWAGERDLNSVSLGIELVNAGHEGGRPPYPAAQIDRLIALLHDLTARHKIVKSRILAHSDIAPDRKEDPGEWFPWDRLAAAGLGLWVPAPIPGPPHDVTDAAQVQRALRILGYDCPQSGRFDESTRAVITAFQRHHRPARVDGWADGSTWATLTTLRDLRPQDGGV